MIIMPSCCMCVHLPFSAEDRAVTMQNCFEIKERSSESVEVQGSLWTQFGFQKHCAFLQGVRRGWWEAGRAKEMNSVY